MERGELIEPFTCCLPLDKDYDFIHPKRQPLSPSAKPLKERPLQQPKRIN
ncbi:MAG: hypothetical protein V7739_06850 [Motiliproteus sp.]